MAFSTWVMNYPNFSTNEMKMLWVGLLFRHNFLSHSFLRNPFPTTGIFNRTQIFYIQILEYLQQTVIVQSQNFGLFFGSVSVREVGPIPSMTLNFVPETMTANSNVLYYCLKTIDKQKKTVLFRCRFFSLDKMRMRSDLQTELHQK